MKISLDVCGPLAVLGASFLVGCGAVPDGSGQEGFESETEVAADENVGQVQQAIGSPGDVGVIANGTSCPAGTSLGQAYMDTEDDAGQTSSSGWKGSWTVGSSTGVTMRVCRVPGAQFKPLTTNPNATDKFYAVLQMGESCPAQSVPFRRTFDNEDDSNGSGVQLNSDMAPSTFGSSSTVRFCLFRNASTAAGTMPDFPFLFGGLEYGIFAKNTAPPVVLASGSVYTDDEDDGNNNSLNSDSANITAQAATIINPGANTRMWMTRVW
jgi:hypothetical protein